MVVSNMLKNPTSESHHVEPWLTPVYCRFDQRPNNFASAIHLSNSKLCVGKTTVLLRQMIVYEKKLMYILVLVLQVECVILLAGINYRSSDFYRCQTIGFICHQIIVLQASRVAERDSWDGIHFYITGLSLHLKCNGYLMTIIIHIIVWVCKKYGCFIFSNFHLYAIV